MGTIFMCKQRNKANNASKDESSWGNVMIVNDCNACNDCNDFNLHWYSLVLLTNVTCQMRPRSIAIHQYETASSQADTAGVLQTGTRQSTE